LFDVPLQPYPGKPIVVMLPVETEREGIIKYIPKEVAEKYAPDFGVVAAFKPSLDSEGDPTNRHDEHLKVGMLVAVKPYTGNWYTHSDFDWIPEGRTVKILGTVEPWWENIIAAVETDEAAA
jgi:hypothetical protein